MNLRLKWVLSFFLWATVHAIADDYWNVENGELLRQIDFEGLLKLAQANQEFFVYIYMKDCGICEKVKPMLLEALAKYKEETDDEFVIYAIDNVRYGERIDKETAYWKQTEGVPFFGMFKGGKKLFEIDPRSTDSFLKFFHNPVAPYVPPPEPEWSSLPSAKDISFLEENGFDAFVGSKSEVFLMVFKTHCGACTAAKPNFEEVATKLSSEKPEITLAALKMTKGNAIINRYNVQAYPTFLYFSGGKFQYEYHGGYKADKLESFCRNPSFIEKPKADLGFTVETNVTILDASADKFLADNEGVLVMVHTSWCGHCKRMKPDYIRASDELFAQGSKQRLAAIEGDKFRDWLEPYGVTGFPTLLYFEKGQFKMKYSGGRTKTAILKFMKNPQEQKEKVLTDEILESLPDTIPALKKDTFDDFIEENPGVVVYFYAPWCGVCKGSKTAFYEAYEMADEEDLDVKFAVYNADPKDDPAEMLFAKEFGIKSYPTVWFFEEGEQKYKFNAQSDMDSFLRFAREPHLRGRVNTVDSDPKWISADGNMYIEILTDETYEEFVAENEEVFIFWVAEGCIRCYEIVQPEFVILAETLATLKPSFKLAVIDGRKGSY